MTEPLAARITPALVERALAGPAVFPSSDGPFAFETRGAAGVVVPLGFSPEPWALVVVRSEDLDDHPGELGFPGGKPNAGEELRAAALRELGEELGLDAARARELGRLTPIPVVTGKFLITPFVVELSVEASPRIASPELTALIRVPLAPYLEGQQGFAAFATTWRGEPFLLPHFRLGERVLYGASACIFWELLAKMARELGVHLAEPVIETEMPWGDRYGR